MAHLSHKLGRAAHACLPKPPLGGTKKNTEAGVNRADLPTRFGSHRAKGKQYQTVEGQYLATRSEDRVCEEVCVPAV